MDGDEKISPEIAKRLDDLRDWVDVTDEKEKKFERGPPPKLPPVRERTTFSTELKRLSGNSKSDEEDQVKIQSVSADEEAAALKLKDAANELFRKKEYDAAIELYSKSLDIDPRSSVVLANRALCFLKQEKFRDAEADCSEGIALDCTNVKVFHRRGLARVGMKKFSAAVEDFDEALALDPKNLASVKERGAAVEKMKEIDSRVDEKIDILANSAITAEGGDFTVGPRTVTEFEKVWSRIKDLEPRRRYLALIDPPSLPKIFRSCLKDRILADILLALAGSRDGEWVCGFVEHLIDVPRFSMIVRFLSREERECLAPLLSSNDLRTERIRMALGLS